LFAGYRSLLVAAKYCQHRQTSRTIDVFERCAIFRGIDLGLPTALASNGRRHATLSET
jgi:hypothetical protein